MRVVEHVPHRWRQETPIGDAVVFVHLFTLKTVGRCPRGAYEREEAAKH